MGRMGKPSKYDDCFQAFQSLVKWYSYCQRFKLELDPNMVSMVTMVSSCLFEAIFNLFNKHCMGLMRAELQFSWIFNKNDLGCFFFGT